MGNIVYRFINETGNKYGEYTVIQFIRTDKVHTWYRVKCSCGKEETKRIDRIKSDINARCRECKKQLRRGIIKDNEIDLTDKTYNNIKVIRKSSKKNIQGFSSLWDCVCPFCGREFTTYSSNLRNNLVRSCGCLVSAGEKITQDFLNKHDIEYKKEYSFPELRSKKNKLLRFDFAIFKDNKIIALIEIDGRQHFEYKENWSSSKEDFEEAIERDKMKNIFCELKGIPLLRITYQQVFEEELIKFLSTATKGDNK